MSAPLDHITLSKALFSKGLRCFGGGINGFKKNQKNKQTGKHALCCWVNTENWAEYFAHTNCCAFFGILSLDFTFSPDVCFHWPKSLKQSILNTWFYWTRNVCIALVLTLTVLITSWTRSLNLIGIFKIVFSCFFLIR